MKRTILGILVLLSAFMVVASIGIEYQKSEAGEGTCFATGESCDLVQTSSYAHWFGIPVTVVGLLGALSLSFVFGLMWYVHGMSGKVPSTRVHNLASLLCVAGAIIAGWFIYVQFFVLDVVCTYCMTVDVTMIATAGLYLVTAEPLRLYQ